MGKKRNERKERTCTEGVPYGEEPHKLFTSGKELKEHAKSHRLAAKAGLVIPKSVSEV